jgi:hypothetical protein
MGSSTGDVEIRSEVTPEGDTMIIDIRISDHAGVAFELYDTQGDIIHLWHAQALKEGRHKLSLPLPQLSQGKYVLHVVVDDIIYKQLLFR